MRAFVVVILTVCITCLVGCHPKKIRPLETTEEEEAARPGKTEEEGPVVKKPEEPIRPIRPSEAEEIILKDIHFEYDKYNLTDRTTAVLGENAEVLMRHPKARILIEGHCDERGTEEYNLALGEKRALAARDFLIRFGIDRSRVSVISYGEERPVDFGHDEESWAKNRRAHFVMK
jgi:peptidoglycan-associated lipoprotein